VDVCCGLRIIVTAVSAEFILCEGSGLYELQSSCEFSLCGVAMITMLML
jgi:hypothetical protein